jgi:hypothetical protein
MDMYWVFFVVRAEFLNIITSFGFKGLREDAKYFVVVSRET